MMMTGYKGIGGQWESLAANRRRLEKRVAKCHGYDGYIRVKILASWGKSLGEHTILPNFLEEICTIYVKCLSNLS